MKRCCCRIQSYGNLAAYKLLPLLFKFIYFWTKSNPGVIKRIFYVFKLFFAYRRFKESNIHNNYNFIPLYFSINIETGILFLSFSEIN